MPRKRKSTAERRVNRVAGQTVAGKSGHHTTIMEVKDPERAVVALQALATPGGSMRKAAEAAGISLTGIIALKKRNRDWLGRERELQAVALRDVSSDLVTALKLKSRKLVEDPDALEKLSMRDLANATVNATAMADKLAASDGVVETGEAEQGFKRVMELQARIVSEAGTEKPTG